MLWIYNIESLRISIVYDVGKFELPLPFNSLNQMYNYLNIIVFRTMYASFYVERSQTSSWNLQLHTLSVLYSLGQELKQAKSGLIEYSILLIME